MGKASKGESPKQILDRLAEPEMFRMWLAYHAKRPSITGMYLYCESNGFGMNPNGHWVRSHEIYAGYRGHRICRACAEKHYGHIERVAQEKAREKQGVAHAG